MEPTRHLRNEEGDIFRTPLALQSINLVEIRLPKTFAALYIQPNLITTPVKRILKISHFTPFAFRYIFWHGQFVSDQVQIRFHI
jgi:hypothetical protein